MTLARTETRLGSYPVSLEDVAAQVELRLTNLGFERHVVAGEEVPGVIHVHALGEPIPAYHLDRARLWAAHDLPMTFVIVATQGPQARRCEKIPRRRSCG